MGRLQTSSHLARVTINVYKYQGDICSADSPHKKYISVNDLAENNPLGFGLESPIFST